MLEHLHIRLVLVEGFRRLGHGESGAEAKEDHLALCLREQFYRREHLVHCHRQLGHLGRTAMVVLDPFGHLARRGAGGGAPVVGDHVVASDAEDPRPERAALFPTLSQREWPPLEPADGPHDLQEDLFRQVFRVGLVADAGETEAIERCDVHVVEPPDRRRVTAPCALHEHAFFGYRQVWQRGFAPRPSGEQGCVLRCAGMRIRHDQDRSAEASAVYV